MTIVFVGSNPSEASPDCEPFQRGTQSRRVLEAWIEAAGIDLTERKSVFLYNIANKPTPNNRALKKSEIISYIPLLKSILQSYTKIVSLGKTAHTALEMAGIAHLEMPHPSGRNFKLNNKDYVAACIERLRVYINEK